MGGFLITFSSPEIIGNINYLMIIPRGEIFKSGLLIINDIFILTSIQYLSAKHMLYAYKDQWARCATSDLNVHFDYPLDSTPLRNQQPPDVQRRPPLRCAGI
jgi:hypothetical protein